MRPLFAFAAAAVFSAACSGGTPTSPSLPPSLPGSASFTMLTRGTLRATVDGAPWASALVSGSVGSFAGLPPQLTLSAVSATSRLSLAIATPAAAGTYHAVGTPSGLATFSLLEGFDHFWWAGPTAAGSHGTVTITTATTTRVAGTFSFTAAARTQGTTPALRTVTDGTFDVER